MFDPVTTALLRAAPAVPGLNPENIPQLLTRHYASLIAARLRGTAYAAHDDDEWPLGRIADTYELLTSVHRHADVRRASAFVAGTAQQILARRELSEDEIARPLVDRDQAAPAIAAPLLFLAAEQYADAYEAAGLIVIPDRDQLYEARILAENVRDLGRGRLNWILER